MQIGTAIEQYVPNHHGKLFMSFALSKLNNNDARGIGRALFAFGSAELMNRIVRILVVVVIARQLVPELVGVAALTLSLFELIRVIANIGVGQKIIAASDNLLEPVCNSAYQIFWKWCTFVAIVQLIAASVLYIFFDQPLAAQMLAILCGVYFFMPGGLVQCFRLMRDKKLATVAKIGASQTIADHLLTGALVLAWANPWAIILPKLLTAPLWLFMMRNAEKWSFDRQKGLADREDMLNFGAAVLATDVLLALRNNLDKLTISALLGVTALGSYYFAFNAGIGIIGALATAFGTVIYPYLCNPDVKNSSRDTLIFVITAGTVLFGGLSAAQFFLAPIYVPLIFGAHWADAIQLIQILSLASIPLVIGAIGSAYLRSVGRANLDVWIGLTTCIAALGAMTIGAQTGLVQAAIGWVGGTAAAIGIISIFFFINWRLNRLEIAQ